MSKPHLYSEIFFSIQGEGKYTGVPTTWLRHFLCNLQCNGFGQKDPTNPDTYILPYEEFNVDKIEVIEDLPVWKYGCDSSYSWAKKFKKLQRTGTGAEIAERMISVLKNEHNPDGLFKHPLSGQENHLCFTGGEPLQKQSQKAQLEILDHMRSIGNSPSYITYETNGTQPLLPETIGFYDDYDLEELFFSVSPKLWTVAGEESKRAICPSNVAEYQESWGWANVDGQLKFVMGDKPEQWEELDSVIKQFRAAGVTWPVWIMPVGATVEGQQDVGGIVAKMAFDRGFNVAARVHTYLFGNAIGT